MTKSNSFEAAKFAKKSLLALSLTAGSLGLASFMNGGVASASGPDMSYLVTNSAKKIVNEYEAHKNDPKIATAIALANHETDITISLPSAYGSFVLSATVSSLVNVNPRTVSHISIESYFPVNVVNTKPQEAARYSLSLDKGHVTEATANYINQNGTEYLNLTDKINNSIEGYPGQPGLGVIIADEHKTGSQTVSNKSVEVYANMQQRMSDANVIGYTMDNLISEAKLSIPIDGGTIAPPFPLAGNFR